MTTPFVNHSIENGIAVITADHPPVNVLDRETRQQLLDTFTALKDDASIDAVILQCAGKTFFSGMDIDELKTGLREPLLPDLEEVIERFPVPVIAAMHGTVLGGGLEIAMACHYRCADAGTRLGMPEITLGIIPGAGGTQRLPRLIGARAALELMLNARPINATAALGAGLVDNIAESDILQSALAYTRQLLDTGTPVRCTSELSTSTEGFDPDFLAECRKLAAKRYRGQHAPGLVIEAVTAAAELPFAEGMQREAELLDKAMTAVESKSLISIFFAEKEIGKIPGLEPFPKSDLLNIHSAAVIGAGTMGSGIAMALANAGIPVRLVDVSREGLDRGLAHIRKTYERDLARGRLNQEKFASLVASIDGTTEFETVAGVDLVIEAVFEDMGLKKEIFTRLDALCKPDAILATNTSTLDIDEIAAVTSRPESVIGLHFFSPANVMRLLEIVRGAKTSPKVLASSVQLAKTMGKVGVVVGVCFGFVGNRMMLEGYVREADQMLLEGATPEQVDRAIYDFGFAMGPFAMNDMAGLDVSYRIRQTTNAAERYPEPYHTVMDAIAAEGHYGQKTGRGMYRYEPGDRTPHNAPETLAVIEREAARLDIPRRPFEDEEVAERCVLALINEGAKILEEGIAYRAGDIDVIWVNGYGFPRYKGGPMCYADNLGLDNVLARVRELHAEFGDYWKPAPLLERLASTGQSFYQWSNSHD